MYSYNNFLSIVNNTVIMAMAFDKTSQSSFFRVIKV